MKLFSFLDAISTARNHTLYLLPARLSYTQMHDKPLTLASDFPGDLQISDIRRRWKWMKSCGKRVLTVSVLQQVKPYKPLLRKLQAGVKDLEVRKQKSYVVINTPLCLPSATPNLPKVCHFLSISTLSTTVQFSTQGGGRRSGYHCRKVSIVSILNSITIFLSSIIIYTLFLNTRNNPKSQYASLKKKFKFTKAFILTLKIMIWQQTSVMWLWPSRSVAQNKGWIFDIACRPICAIY